MDKNNIGLFVADLTVIDFSFFDEFRGLLGESWIVDVELAGKVDTDGILFDFTYVKKKIKQRIDELVDHKLLIPALNSNLSVQKSNNQVVITGHYDHSKYFYHSSPDEAVNLLPFVKLTKQQLAKFLSVDLLQSVMPENVIDVKVKLRNEVIRGAWFQYSHGLKHHFGNCQRIAHGHRSKIHIYVDNKRDKALELEWARHWSGIYLIQQEDKVETLVKQGQDYYRCAYKANQGVFELIIEAQRCELLLATTTIENIARHVAGSIASQLNKKVKVQVFEGINKGAIAYA